MKLKANFTSFLKNFRLHKNYAHIISEGPIRDTAFTWSFLQCAEYFHKVQEK